MPILTSSNSGVKYGVELSQTGIVIPAFNAGTTVGKIVRELIEYGFKAGNIIVVDDGSSDRTGDEAEKAGAVVIKNERNMGKGFSLRRGFERAEAKGLDRVFTLDADGQHRVREIGNFLKNGRGCDILIGERTFEHDRMPLFRRLVNRTTSLVISLLGGELMPDVQSGYRLIDLKVLRRFRLRTNNFQTEAELACKASRSGFRVGSVPITAVYDGERSYIRPMIDTIRFIEMAVRFLWR